MAAPAPTAPSKGLTSGQSLLAAIGLLVASGPGATAVQAGLAIVLGLLPAAVAIAGGNVVQAASEIGQRSADLSSPEGHRLVLAVGTLAAVFVVSQVVQVVATALREVYRLKVRYHVEHRTMAAALAPPLLDHLEGPLGRHLIESVTSRTRPAIAAFAADGMIVISERVGALSAAVLVARFDLRVSVGLVILWSAIGRSRRRQSGPAIAAAATVTRRAQYYRTLALDRNTAAELRIFGLAPWLLNRFDYSWYEAMSEVWRRRRSARWRTLPVTVAIVTANAAAFSLMAAAASRGELGAGDVVVVGSAMLGLSQLGLGSKADRGVAEGRAIAPVLLEFERLTTAEVGRTRPIGTPCDARGRPVREIRFEAVRFTYPGRTAPVFDGLDLVVPAGRTLAIVGINGAGKTTLVKLLSRLHDPDEGRITVDGIPLSMFAPADWQRRIAAIFQDFTRFELSARDNVSFGAAESYSAVTKADGLMRKAAERAGALELIEHLPFGWSTILSRRFEQGAELSGGEWQRIAMARALMAVETGAGVLILDEPTSNLDVRGESELFGRIAAANRRCTTILISHRFSTVRRADHIVVLERGRVVEEGTHRELVDAKGRYAASFALQAARYVGKAPNVDG